MSKTGTPELPTLAFPSVPSFETFLEREHASAPGIHLKFAKKGSGIPSITWAEAVEVALCYGWIDGRANSIDDKWWMVRYTPRRAKSIWSQKNVITVARLIEEGRMRPAGLAVVEAAKADGRWARAYAGPATMTTPEDFTKALVAHPTAEAYFESLSKSEKYTVLMPLATISDKNRTKKIDSLVQNMAVGKGPTAAKASTKSSKDTKKKDKRKSVTTNAPAKVMQTSLPQVKTLQTENTAQRKPNRDGLRRRT